MKRCAPARAGSVILSILVVATATPVAAQAMKVAAESIPIPTDDEPQPLTEVRYGVTWTVDFRSIQLEVDSEPGADKVKAVWTVTGVNSRPRPTRAQLTVILLSGDDKSLESVRKSLMVKPGGEPHEYVLEMKVKSEDWERAERVKLQANFFVGR